MATILPYSSGMCGPGYANIMDMGGWGGFQVSAASRRQAQLRGVLVASRSTLQLLIRMVEGLMKQSTSSWQVVRVHS